MGVADTASLLEILEGLNLLTSQQKETAASVFADRDDPPEQLDRLIGAYLVNKDLITAEQLELAEICQQGLRDPSLLVQTKTHVKMAKFAATQIRRMFQDNQSRSEAILKSTERVKAKSSSSEYISVGLMARKLGDDDSH